MDSQRSHKQFLSFIAFIDSIKRKERSIIFGPDYVVLSKEAYEALIDYHQPKLTSVQYDETFMYDWLKKRFIELSRD